MQIVLPRAVLTDGSSKPIRTGINDTCFMTRSSDIRVSSEIQTSNTSNARTSLRLRIMASQFASKSAAVLFAYLFYEQYRLTHGHGFGQYSILGLGWVGLG